MEKLTAEVQESGRAQGLGQAVGREIVSADFEGRDGAFLREIASKVVVLGDVARLARNGVGCREVDRGLAVGGDFSRLALGIAELGGKLTVIDDLTAAARQSHILRVVGAHADATVFRSRTNCEWGTEGADGKGVAGVTAAVRGMDSVGGIRTGRDGNAFGIRSAGAGEGRSFTDGALEVAHELELFVLVAGGRGVILAAQVFNLFLDIEASGEHVDHAAVVALKLFGGLRGKRESPGGSEEAAVGGEGGGQGGRYIVHTSGVKEGRNVLGHVGRSVAIGKEEGFDAADAAVADLELHVVTVAGTEEVLQLSVQVFRVAQGLAVVNVEIDSK